MNDFVLDIPVKVYFGKDQIGNLGLELSKYGKRVLLTYGGGSIKKTGLYDRVVAEIKKAGLELFELSGIDPNPRIDSVRAGAKICKEENIDVLLAVGGGSTLDCTKYIGAAALVDHDPWDFFEKWAPIEKALPLVTILTLSATGSEMNCGGVISNPETDDKIGRLAKPLMPKVSFLDPTNTFTVSPYQTACGSVDIMSHIMEIYFNMNRDFDMVDSLMEGMMKSVIKYAPIAIKNPEDYEARANLMWVSSWAINGFANGSKAQEWSCHPIEHEISAIYDITHGLGLAILTPPWLEYCLDESTVSRYAQFGINVFDIDRNLPPMEIARKSINELRNFFFNTLGLKKSFTEIDIDNKNFKLMAKKACQGKVIHGFKPLGEDEIVEIFEMCLKS